MPLLAVSLLTMFEITDLLGNIFDIVIKTIRIKVSEEKTKNKQGNIIGQLKSNKTNS